RERLPGIRRDEAQDIGLAVVEQHTVPKRHRVVSTFRQRYDRTDLPSIELQQSAGPESAEIHAPVETAHAVQVQVVRLCGTVAAAGIESRALQAADATGDMQAPGKPVLVQIEPQQRIEAGRREIKPPAEAADLVTMLEVRRTVGSEPREVAVVHEQFVAGGDEHALPIECNAPKPPVPAATLPVYVGGVPVDRLCDSPVVEVDEVNAAVAFALLAAANHRGCDQCGHFWPAANSR